MTTWRVNCAGHIDPHGAGKDRACWREGYTEPHTLNVLELVRAAELLTHDIFSEGDCLCVLEVLAGDKTRRK